MKTLEYIAQALELSFGLLLVTKLLSLRLHIVYRLFSYFLVTELLGSALWLTQRLLMRDASNLDYRLIWATERFIVCILIVLTVYALLDAVLRTLPGILSFSRRFLNWTFGCAGVVGLLSLTWESQQSGYLNQRSWQDDVLFVGIMTDRVVSSIVLLSIFSILCFLLWFPIKIPRNLSVFIVGFAIYSAGSAAGLLVQSLMVHDTSRWVSTSIELLMSGCVGFWAMNISSAGERVPSQLAIRRDPQREHFLIHSLEQLNDSLLRNAGR